MVAVRLLWKYTSTNCTVPDSVFKGRLQSLDWTSGLDWWTGLVDWTGGLDCGLTGGLTLKISLVPGLLSRKMGGSLEHLITCPVT